MKSTTSPRTSASETPYAAINEQTHGPVTFAARFLTHAYRGNPLGEVYSNRPTDEMCATGHLFASAYTMADRAGRELGVDASALCEELDLAGLITSLRACVFDLECVIRHNRTPGNKRTVSEVMLRGMECHAEAARAILSRIPKGSV